MRIRNQTFLALLFGTLFLLPSPVRSQYIDTDRIPSPESIQTAKNIVDSIFHMAGREEYDSAGTFIYDHSFFRFAPNRETLINRYARTFRTRNNKPGGIGVRQGLYYTHDLIEVGLLRGTERYFRLSYISYHARGIMVWQFRFILDPQNQVKIHFWEPRDYTDPFQYMGDPERQWLKHDWGSKQPDLETIPAMPPAVMPRAADEAPDEDDEDDD